MAKASSLGFGVSKPWVEERYDFVLDSGYRFWRVRVKSTTSTVPPGYLVRFMGKNQAPYNHREIDFAVAYLVPGGRMVCHSGEVAEGTEHDDFLSAAEREVEVGEVSRSAGARWLVLMMKTGRARL